MLDHNLRAEFPAQLTRRSGISRHALAFMRTCFQHGLGSKQFSNALRIQHLQLHDELHLQYLHHLPPQKDLSVWQGKTFKPFLAFDDETEDGFMDSHQMHSGSGMYMTTLLSATRMTSINILRCSQEMYAQLIIVSNSQNMSQKSTVFRSSLLF